MWTCCCCGDGGGGGVCGQMSVQPPASRGSVFHPDELWCCFSEGLDWPQINPHVSALEVFSEAGYNGGRGGR